MVITKSGLSQHWSPVFIFSLECGSYFPVSSCVNFRLLSEHWKWYYRNWISYVFLKGINIFFNQAINLAELGLQFCFFCSGWQLKLQFSSVNFRWATWSLLCTCLVQRWARDLRFYTWNFGCPLSALSFLDLFPHFLAGIVVLNSAPWFFKSVRLCAF